MKVFIEFLRQAGEMRLAELIPPEELNKHISSFLLSVRKLDGTEFEPVSLRAYLSSIERYLKNKNYPVSVTTDIQFRQCREILKLKQKQLKGMGKGNKPYAADDITDVELNQMYEKGVLGCTNPKALVNSLFMICTNHFGMRPGKEVHDLKWGDIKLGFDEDNNTEYIIYSQERQTKTRTGVNTRDTRKIKPRAYAAVVDPSKDPVFLYKLFKEKRPSKMTADESPFFRAINYMALKQLDNPDIPWYKNSTMGINKLYLLVKDMKNSAELTSDRRLTNHSMRKHLVQKLSDAGVPPNQIVQISGHRNLNSLNNYSKINHNQNLQISNILSVGDVSHYQVRPTVPAHTAPPPSENQQELAKCDPTPVAKSPSKAMSIFSGSTFHGVVNVSYYGEQTRSNSQWNVGVVKEHMSTADGTPPKKYRRILPIDSDSD